MAKFNIEVQLLQNGKWVLFKPPKETKLIFNAENYLWSLVEEASDGNALLFMGAQEETEFGDVENGDYVYMLKSVKDELDSYVLSHNPQIKNNLKMKVTLDQKAQDFLDDELENMSIYVCFVVGPYIPKTEEKPANAAESKDNSMLYVIGAAALLAGVYLAAKK